MNTALQLRLCSIVAVLGILGVGGEASAVPETGLVISEIFFDATGNDNQRQWVELYNGTGSDVDLSGYSLGFGRTDYTRTRVQLIGTVLAGDTFVVGGPISDAQNANPFFDQAIDFSPNIRSGGQNNRPDGVALFQLPASSIVTGSDPIHTVIYGEATATPDPWLTDESGNPGTGSIAVFIPTSGIAGQSIALQGDGSWAIEASPSPGVSNLPEAGTLFLFGIGGAGLRILRRR